jgi:cytidylate kinase
MSKLPNIEQILERQARSWELRRRIAGEGGEAAREALAHLQQGPWVTISRQLGAGGDELASKLGKQLGWEVYDREILSAIAEQTRSRERIMAELDEKTVAPFQEFIARLLVRDDPSQLEYVTQLAHVVWGLARKGQAIIVGRAANWFLDDRYGLRLRIVAPYEQRVERVAREMQTGPGEARKLVQAHDTKREVFVEQYFGQQINDPLGYDLIVNTGALDPESVHQIALTALRKKLAGPAEEEDRR